MTATRKAEAADTAPEGVRVEVVERQKGRPTGKGFGSLVHEVLATADLRADLESLRSLAQTLGRILGNTDEEIAAAADATSRALEHPLLQQAASASQTAGLCLRESPLVHRQEDGSLIEGVMDLAFRERPDAPWTVVDFKTDVRVDIRQEEYRRQVALYMEALRQASGSEAQGFLLYV
jgi:ATP-dependent exoDNAse (exonuclease V) beta subunit